MKDEALHKKLWDDDLSLNDIIKCETYELHTDNEHLHKYCGNTETEEKNVYAEADMYLHSDPEPSATS